MKFMQSNFDGRVRSYVMQTPRDVQPGKVAVQLLHADGSVWREYDVGRRLLVEVERIARRGGLTLNQMLARVIAEGAIKLWESERGMAEQEES